MKVHIQKNHYYQMTRLQGVLRIFLNELYFQDERGFMLYRKLLKVKQSRNLIGNLRQITAREGKVDKRNETTLLETACQEPSEYSDTDICSRPSCPSVVFLTQVYLCIGLFLYWRLPAYHSAWICGIFGMPCVISIMRTF